MSRQDSTVLARNPLLFLEYALSHGLQDKELMRSVGLTDSDLSDPDSRIPLATMRKLWGTVIAHTNDPLLGLNVGRSLQVRRMGLVGYAMYFSTDLRGALHQLARYGRIVSEAVQFRLDETAEEAVLQCITHPFMITLRHPIEAAMALVVTAARELTQEDVVPVSVRLPLPHPTSTAPYELLFGTNVSFECPAAEMTFAPRQLDLVTQAPDATLNKYLTNLAESTLRDLGKQNADLVDEVRRHLWSMLPSSKPDLQIVAARLCMSPRTLQRRLGEAGTSFSSVLEELRREMSEELRVNQGFAAADIAFLLGYSESSAYQRAARRWRRDISGHKRVS